MDVQVGEIEEDMGICEGVGKAVGGRYETVSREDGGHGGVGGCEGAGAGGARGVGVGGSG